MEVKLRPECLSIPGYIATQRELQAAGGIPRAAWNRLGLFSAPSAEEFLAAPARTLAERARNDEKSVNESASDFAELAMLFAVLAVHADREQRNDEIHTERVKEEAVGPIGF